MTITSAQPSLRERKKQQQRRHIQSCALELFLRASYAQTSVEQIAQAAEIAPATFFNYFPTKESVVFDMLFDPSLFTLLSRQPMEASFIDALYASCRTLLDSLPEQEIQAKERCFALINKTPELRNGLAAFISIRGVDLLATLVADRSGRSATDLRCRVLAGSIVGVAIAILLEPGDCTAVHCIERFCAGLTELGPELRRI